MTLSANSPANSYVLTFSCPDQLGVVSRVAGLLAAKGAFITDISQYSDPDTIRFFSRTVFDDRHMEAGVEPFEADFRQLAEDLDMAWILRPVTRRCRVLVAVSRYDHCLNPLLTKWQNGALDVDLVGVVSNHETARAITEFYGLPFHYLPVTPQTKPEQEAAIRALIDEQEVDLFVLARYMQILSADFCADLPGRIINIHHSFLPGFKGARPYHQAHDRGVKVIGATAHFVTRDLDEGPIIVQEVRPIDHRVTVAQMVHIGHDLEATALAQAVKLFSEERIVLNGIRTVVL